MRKVKTIKKPRANKAAPKPAKGGNINPKGKRTGSTVTNKNTKQLRTEVTKKAMIQALYNSLGVIETACRECGVSRNWHYETYRTDPEYKAQVDEMKNIALDYVESRLFQNIKNGDVTSTIFYLKTQGKTRGYIERQEVQVNKEAIVQVGYGEDEE